MSKSKRQNEEPERKTFHYVDRDVSEPFMIPDSYSQIDPAQMQELQMPEGSLSYTIATGNATGIVVCFEVPPETAMPFDNPEDAAAETERALMLFSGVINKAINN